MKTTFIYALCEPGTRTIRYIGQTNCLKRRLQQHCRTRKKTHYGNWIRSLSSPPVLVILHEVSVSESWQEEERRYISCARAIGMDLVNATDGGEGFSGPHSPEARAAMSAAKKGVTKGPLSPEHCSAISASLKGVPHSPERCAAQSAAKKGVPRGPHSPEALEAMSAAKKGVPLSPEHCASLSAAKKGVPHSPERRAAQSARQKGVPHSPERCAAISASKKGVPRGPHSPEHCAAMSAANKGVPWSPARRAAEERRPKV